VVAKGKGSSRPKDLWNPDTIDKEEAYRLIDDARDALRLLRNSLPMGDRWLLGDYNKAFENIESLYSILHIGELTQDNQRDWNAHKAMLRKKGLTDT